MRSFLNVTIGVAVVIASALFPTPARMAWAQGITPSDVEQQVRASLSAWNYGDPTEIVGTPGPGVSGEGGVGFGYRSEAARRRSVEEQLAIVRGFLASAEYCRVTVNEVYTAVDGDVGLAWGVFTEEFHVRGRAPEKVRVRFTSTFKREAGRWRQLLFHRDAQPFDDKGKYIPSVTALN